MYGELTNQEILAGSSVNLFGCDHIATLGRRRGARHRLGVVRDVAARFCPAVILLNLRAVCASGRNGRTRRIRSAFRAARSQDHCQQCRPRKRHRGLRPEKYTRQRRRLNGGHTGPGVEACAKRVGVGLVTARCAGGTAAVTRGLRRLPVTCSG